MSAIDRIRKKRELLEIEKSGGSQLDVSKKRIEQNRNDLATTGKIDYGETTKFISPIKKKNTKDDGSWTGLFNDGYDRWDISKTILRGGKSLLKTGYKTGKEIVTNPIKSAKTFGVSTAAGLDKARNAIDGAVGDFVDWITPDSWERKSEGPTIAEFNKAITSNSKEEREKVLKQLEKDLDKDDKLYKTLAKDLTSKDTRSDTVKAIDNIINGKYYNTDTYKKYQEGKLSEGQKNIWNVGENIGAMIPSVAVSTVASPVAGSALFYTQAQQNYTEEAKLRGYTDKEARTYGLIMGGAEVLVERLGFDELGGLSKLSQQSIKKAMVGEGLEEFVMPYIDSAVKSVGFDEEFDMVGTTKEAFEGAVLGATVGAIMSAGGRGMMKVDNFIEKVNNGERITQNDIVEAGRELEQNDPNTLQEAISEVPEVVRTQTQTQPTRTVEEIETEIGTLESQLNENLSDEEYKAVQEEIRTREDLIEQIENGPTQVEQTVQPTTQEVETKSLVEPSSNTLETGKTLQEQLETQANDVVQKELAEKQAMIEMFEDYVSENNITNPTEQDITNSLDSYDVYDNEADISDVEQKYVETIKEYLKETNKVSPVEEKAKEPLVMAEEEYLGSKGYGFMGYSEAGLHNSSQHDSKSGRKQMVDHAQNKAIEYDQKREELRKEYQEKVANGEIRKPTGLEQRLKIAQGIDGREDVEAARRNLTRMGIDWKTGEKISQTEKSESISPKEEKNKNLSSKKERPKWTETEEGIIKHFKDLQKSSNEGKKPGDRHYQTDEEVQEVIDYALGMLKKDLAKQQKTSDVQKDLEVINNATKDLKQVQTELKEQANELKEQIEEMKALTKEQGVEVTEQHQSTSEQLNEMVEPESNNLTQEESQRLKELETIDEKFGLSGAEQLELEELQSKIGVEQQEDSFDTIPLDDKTLRKATKFFKKTANLTPTERKEFDNVIKELSKKGNLTAEDIENELRNYEELNIREKNNYAVEVKRELANISNLRIPKNFNIDIDMVKYREMAKGHLKFKMADNPNVDQIYEELSEQYKGFFPDSIVTPAEQFQTMVEVASSDVYSKRKEIIPDETIKEEAEYIYEVIQSYRSTEKFKDASKSTKQHEKSMKGQEAPVEVKQESPVVKQTKPNKESFVKKVEETNKEIKNELGYIPKDPTKAESYEYDEKTAKIISEEPKTPKEEKNKLWAWIKANIFDRGMVFEDLAIKHKNRNLQAKWDFTLTSNSRAQYVIANGHGTKDNKTSKSLEAIMEEVNNTGHTKEFYEYMYHQLNVDRMSLETKAKAEAIELDKRSAKITDTKEKSEIEARLKELAKVMNKPVFGHSITAEMSQEIVLQIEEQYPDFKKFAQDVYDYVNADRTELVNKGVISQETADLWQEMYPHYVPIRRADHNGLAINVALDTNRTGINAPIKKATGGNSDILPLFETMAQRTFQTYRATAKNSFGIELKNTLKAPSIKRSTNVDEVIDTVDNQDGLLQKGENGANPTFTVFQNGERVTYEITEEMYEALKPLSDKMNFTFKPTHIASNIHRGLLTQYNPFFALKNGIKDFQDILINSQHSARTYYKIPEAIYQLFSQGHWFNEYMANGGEQNSYFDSQEMSFDTKHKGISKVLDFWPIKKIAQLNDFIERVPRLAEYIASREMGRNIETSMLDAARVTTNFKAGGNLTKFANRNGVTFLNASVQGALQQVRNVREANMNGARGYANLATKYAVAGIPVIILNSLLWGDDDDYEELSDYVKQNYYIVGKYGDGQFYRIPKGRTVAVIQDAIQQISNVATGNDEADLKSFLDLVVTNLAPTDPLENNIFSPIKQVLTNESWYGEDLVPQRLADLPAEEQFDETTDSFSRWLGEKTGVSPIKINYLLNQYSGVVGDIAMPMITPKATQEGGSPLLAPLKDVFTVDSVMKNQNVSDFYSTSEKLTTGAKSKDATDEDILKNKYINSVKTELNDLYKEKREIQSDESLSKSEKYKQAKEIQKEINALTKDALSKYSDGQYTDNYGIIDDREYYVNTKGDWTAVKEKERDALNEMGMSLEEKSTYFEGKNEISRIVNDYKDDKDDLNDTYEDEELKERIDTLSSEKKTNIIKTIQNTDLSEEQQAYLYKKYYKTDTIDNVLSANIGVDNYFDYIQQEFKADLNKKGNPISGSRKNKVINYVNSYDLTIAQKAILIKSTNTFKFNDYNYDIVEYVGGLDIDYEEKVRILKDLDFKVHDNGTVEWE